MHNQPKIQPDKFLRRREVTALIGLGDSQLYEMISNGVFPKQIKIGGAARWSQKEVFDWMRKQKAARYPNRYSA